MILMAYRHGLRVGELVAFRWDQVDLDAGRLQVIRRKGSDDSVQPLSGVEIHAVRKLRLAGANAERKKARLYTRERRVDRRLLR
jgi:integrase